MRSGIDKRIENFIFLHTSNEYFRCDSRNLETKKPNLFLVGQPRTGTSALHNVLNQHPDIFMSVPKEPVYFTKDLHEESDLFHIFKTNEENRIDPQLRISLMRKFRPEVELLSDSLNRNLIELWGCNKI